MNHNQSEWLYHIYQKPERLQYLLDSFFPFIDNHDDVIVLKEFYKPEVHRRVLDGIQEAVEGRGLLLSHYDDRLLCSLMEFAENIPYSDVPPRSIFEFAKENNLNSISYRSILENMDNMLTTASSDNSTAINNTIPNSTSFTPSNNTPLNFKFPKTSITGHDRSIIDTVNASTNNTTNASVNLNNDVTSPTLDSKLPKSDTSPYLNYLIENQDNIKLGIASILFVCGVIYLYYFFKKQSCNELENIPPKSKNKMESQTENSNIDVKLPDILEDFQEFF